MIMHGPKCVWHGPKCPRILGRVVPSLGRNGMGRNGKGRSVQIPTCYTPGAYPICINGQNFFKMPKYLYISIFTPHHCILPSTGVQFTHRGCTFDECIIGVPLMYTLHKLPKLPYNAPIAACFSTFTPRGCTKPTWEVQCAYQKGERRGGNAFFRGKSR